MTGRCVVSGAAGFVGRALLVAPAGASSWTGWVRREPVRRVPGVEYVSVEDFSAAGWQPPDLTGVDAVVHTAARVHVMNDSSANPLAEFRRVNVDATRALAEAAARAGVRRFVYLSSIKVLGERTLPGQPVGADEAPRPSDPYGISKLEAETLLRRIASESQLEVVVIRPPLMYGAGVRANFLRMMRWVHRGVPLPFGAIHNARSLAGLDNVVDLILRCIDHPAAANQIFNVSDGEDVSTSDLLRRIARAFGLRSRLVPVPARVLSAGAALLGMKSEMSRLCESLQVDIAKTRERLAWSPPVNLDEGLRRAAGAFLAGEAVARKRGTPAL